MVMRDVGIVAERAPEAAVTSGVGDNLFFWVERTNGRAPMLFIVNPGELTTGEVDEVRAQANEWTRRLNAKLRAI